MKVQLGKENDKATIELVCEEEVTAFREMINNYMSGQHENPFIFGADLMAEKLEEALGE